MKDGYFLTAKGGNETELCIRENCKFLKELASDSQTTAHFLSPSAASEIGAQMQIQIMTWLYTTIHTHTSKQTDSVGIR